ncbi:hypothetical protein F1645_16225 (plasmid) [Novacetimonas hansenii]|uniref:Uncharacterized protein n=1 Tax=Novacetimonas hansenii TaxID=436 RepID=A0ABQ0SFZ1_NOVHA|nr:hypothetical protein [Novacetimonas hansenii]GAN83848.1 hypothetical protein Gaha_0105_083 [Novacetimonas hansenii JCM 7643]GBQ62905.1 hypothetical protein AA0243_2989 [Novacetimonas hansenii NRIC 0243]GEC64158.1 hypothetical protein GHA01_20070 [Novacetimonas hansenii]
MTFDSFLIFVKELVFIRSATDMSARADMEDACRTCFTQRMSISDTANHLIEMDQVEEAA